MIKNNKRIIITLFFALILLLIPLIAMQFTNKVNCTLSDLFIEGILLFGVGVGLDFVIRKTKNIKYRIIILVILLLAFILIWGDLAVGIFDLFWSGD